MSTLTTRFAPSPTGDLHVGGARTALYSWLYAHKYHGRFLLRIEDTDLARSTTEAAIGIIESLNWLGLDDYQKPIVYQSQRFARYKEVIDQLMHAGHAYKCYCSTERLDKLREELMAKKEKPKYDGLCRNGHTSHSADQPFVIRFKNPSTGHVLFEDQIKGSMAISNEELDDIIIMRSDGTPTYNFTVVVDDHDQKVTHIIRGDDHLSNTPRQVNILQALGANIPVYAHVPMILGGDGKRLSKRHGANGVMEYRNLGYLPQALLNYLVRLGWSYHDQEVFSIAEMIEKFDLTHVSKSPAAFDNKKLLWLNQHYIKTSDIAALVPELLHQYSLLDINVPANFDFTIIINALRERAKTMKEMAEQSMHVFLPKLNITSELIEAHFNSQVLGYIQDFLNNLRHSAWDEASLVESLNQTLASFNIKMPQLAPSLRVALTGSTNAPSIPHILQMLGKEVAIKRLENVLTF